MKRRLGGILLVTFSILWIACGQNSTAPRPGGAPSGRPHGVPSDCLQTEIGYRCTYGPVSLERAGASIRQEVSAIPEEGYITAARARLVDSEGHRIAHHDAHLHHSWWWDTSREAVFCDHPGEPFYATGNEITELDLPEGYGYLWRNRPASGTDEARWRVTAEIMRMSRQPIGDVYVQLDLEFVPSSEAELTDVRALPMGVKGCAFATPYRIAAGSGDNGRHVKTHDIKMPMSGRFVWATGHMHDGAVEVRLTDLTRGRRIATSKALYGSHHHPDLLTGATNFRSSKGYEVDAGTVIRVTAVYNSRRAVKEAMGNFRTMFVPE